MSFRAIQSICYVFYMPGQCLDYGTKAKVQFASLEYVTIKHILSGFYCPKLLYSTLTAWHEVMEPLFTMD